MAELLEIDEEGSDSRQFPRLARPWGWEGMIVATLVGTTFVAHSFSYVTSQPYWLDEAFVASLSKAPLTRTVALVRTSPIGWVFLLHLVPGRGELQRLVPLAFAAGAAAMAYVLVRSLSWRSRAEQRLAGVIVAGAVLFSPSLLLRNDLKQYTADAFLSLVVLVFAARYEAEPARRRLLELAAAAIVSLCFSTAVAFTIAVAFVSLFVIALASKLSARIRDVVLCGAVVAAVIVVFFTTFVIPNTPSGFTRYWRTWFLTGSPRHIVATAWRRADLLAQILTVPVWAIAVLCLVGCVVLFQLKRPAVALSVPLLWVLMLGLAIAKRYPFLDQRTSTFLLVSTVTLAGIGVVGIVAAIAARSRPIAAVVLVLIVFGYGYQAAPFVRVRSIPNESARNVDLYVADHRVSGDVIVVSFASNWGFSYYWPHGQTRYIDEPSLGQGFITQIIGLPNVIYAGQTADALHQLERTGTIPTDYASDAMRQARALARAPGATGRIWLVRTHYSLAERDLWAQAFQALHLRPVSNQFGGTLINIHST